MNEERTESKEKNKRKKKKYRGRAMKRLTRDVMGKKYGVFHIFYLKINYNSIDVSRIIGVIKATLLLFLQDLPLFILNNKIGGVGWKH